MAQFNEKGEEILDPTPVAVPLQFLRPSHYDIVKAMVRQELSRAAADQGFESFEESEDFDVDNDIDPHSPWELNFDPPAPPATETPPPTDSGGTPSGGAAGPGDGDEVPIKT